MIRITLFVSGRVQGVGFRYTTYEVARSFAITGTVENLDDGRVKIVAEGDSTELDSFWDSVQYHMHGKIKSFDRFESEPSHEFHDFSIKRS